MDLWDEIYREYGFDHVLLMGKLYVHLRVNGRFCISIYTVIKLLYKGILFNLIVLYQTCVKILMLFLTSRILSSMVLRGLDN